MSSCSLSPRHTEQAKNLCTRAWDSGRRAHPWFERQAVAWPDAAHHHALLSSTSRGKKRWQEARSKRGGLFSYRTLPAEHRQEWVSKERLCWDWAPSLSYLLTAGNWLEPRKAPRVAGCSCWAGTSGLFYKGGPRRQIHSQFCTFCLILHTGLHTLHNVVEVV